MMMKKLIYAVILLVLMAACQSVEIQVVEGFYEDGSPKMLMDYLLIKMFLLKIT